MLKVIESDFDVLRLFNDTAIVDIAQRLLGMTDLFTITASLIHSFNIICDKIYITRSWRYNASYHW